MDERLLPRSDHTDQADSIKGIGQQTTNLACLFHAQRLVEQLTGMQSGERADHLFYAGQIWPSHAETLDTHAQQQDSGCPFFAGLGEKPISRVLGRVRDIERLLVLADKSYEPFPLSEANRTDGDGRKAVR